MRKIDASPLSADYKYVLMAHNQTQYRALAKLLSETTRDTDITQVRDLYHRRFMAAISTPASRKNHSNVLLHILGYLKRSVDSAARRDIVVARSTWRLR